MLTPKDCENLAKNFGNTYSADTSEVIKAQRDLFATLDAGIMQPILNTDDNDTPDTMAVATPSFIACVDELTEAGYISITDNLLNWTNGVQKATIEIVNIVGSTDSGLYGVIYHPIPPQTEAVKLYSRILGIEIEASNTRQALNNIEDKLERVETRSLDIGTTYGMRHQELTNMRKSSEHLARSHTRLMVAHDALSSKHYNLGVITAALACIEFAHLVMHALNLPA